MPLIRTLEILADTLGNLVLQRRMRTIAQEVKDGSSLAAALHKHEVITELATGLVEAGEESGQLEVILLRLADYYQQKFDSSLQRLAAMLEPLMIMAVGLLIGTVVIVLGLPFANLVNILS